MERRVGERVRADTFEEWFRVSWPSSTATAGIKKIPLFYAPSYVCMCVCVCVAVCFQIGAYGFRVANSRFEFEAETSFLLSRRDG